MSENGNLPPTKPTRVEQMVRDGRLPSPEELLEAAELIAYAAMNADEKVAGLGHVGVGKESQWVLLCAWNGGGDDVEEWPIWRTLDGLYDMVFPPDDEELAARSATGETA